MPSEPILLKGSGTRRLDLPTPFAGQLAVEVKLGGQFERLPLSDYALEQGGRVLVLVANPSGVAAVWPKGKDTVRVSGGKSA